MPELRTPGRGRAIGPVILTASVGAAVVTSGIQGIAPAIPAVQAEFGLSAAQLALITSIYLLPSVFSALPAGVLADRIGARSVFAGALGVFGAGGIVLLLTHDLATLLAVRFVQGMAFGAVLSLSVAIIGTVAPSGPQAARGQSRRIITMAVAESALPVAGGMLLAFGWFAPFALNVLALPVAVVAWLVLPSTAPARKVGGGAQLRTVLQAPSVVGVQVLGALRFIFKLAVLTYFPVLAVNEIGMTPGVLGLVMGAAALLTAVMAALTERLALRWRSAQLIVGCLVVIAVSLALMGFAQSAAVAALALLVYGVQDGVYGVAHNVLVTEMAPPGARSSYVGLTGTVRNVGKFAAPLLFGAATLVVTISQSFLVLAGVGLGSLAVARRVTRAQVDRDPPVAGGSAEPERLTADHDREPG